MTFNVQCGLMATRTATLKIHQNNSHKK